MKNLLSLFFCLLITVGARAASPAFNEFNLNQFGTNAGVAGNGIRVKSASIQSNNVFWASSSAITLKSADGLTVTLFDTSGTNFFAGVSRQGKSLIISSNTLANLPTLTKGDMAFWSSNGVAYLITSAPDGTLATNILTGTSSGGGFTGNPNQFSVSGTSTNIITGVKLTNVLNYASSSGNSSLILHTPTAPSTAPFAVIVDSGPMTVFTVNSTGTIVGNGYFQSAVSFLLNSNLYANLPPLNPGDFAIWSSNGVPYYITSAPNGTLATNAFASGSGTFQTFVATTTGLTTSGNGTSTATLSSPSAVVTQGVNGLVINGGAGVFGITNKDGSFCITNQINHSFTLITTNGDMISSNGVVGAYIAFTNGAFFCSSNATIGGVLSVLAGTSTTLSNLTDQGWATFAGGFTTVGQTNSNWTYGFASVNDSSGRMTNTFNGSGLTNLDYLLTTNAINTGVGAVGRANITNLTGNVTLGGFSGLVNDKWNTVIWVCQASSANRTVTFPANTYTPDGVHSCVVTNGLWKVISFSILPGLLTNACSVGTF